MRDIDMLGRYGGDEFVVLLLETDVTGAGKIAERIRQGVAQTPVAAEGGPLKVTISVGVAPFAEACPNLAALLNDADVALYAAKKAGKNRVAVKDGIWQ